MYAPIKLKGICSTDPICVAQDAMLADVLALMHDRRISSVIVTEGRRPVGIFTERDALHIIPLGLDIQNTPVRDVMSGPPVVAQQHLDFFEAYHLCAEKNIRHLIVVDAAGDLCGIATDADFMKVLGVDVFSGQEKIEHMMSPAPTSLAPHATVNQAVTLMMKSGKPAVVIVEGSRPAGILTERDLVRLGRTGIDGNTPLARVMTAPVITVSLGRSLYFAIELMRERSIRTLAVTDLQGDFRGILTEHDVVSKIEGRYVGLLTSIIKRQAEDINHIRHELSEKHMLSAVLHEALGISVIVADAAGKALYMNPDAARLLDTATPPGTSLESLYTSAGMATDGLLSGLDTARHGSCCEYEVERRHERKILELRARIAPVRDQNGIFLGFVQTLEDVTDRNRVEHKLKQAASIFDNTVDGIIITDANDAILSVNPAFTRITGYEEDEVRGRNPRMLDSGKQDQTFYESTWEALKTRGYWQGEVWGRHKNGDIYAVWLTVSKVQDDDGSPKNYIGVFADITSSKKIHDEFEYLAHHDPLTRLPNRLLFHARLTHSLSHAARTGNLVAVLMLDLDGFKPINDRFGHQTGDHVLEIVAERLAENRRDEDTVARLGGDEFVVVLEDITSEDSATEIADKLIQAISQPMVLDGCTMSITASVGIALSAAGIKDPKALLRNADSALYEAKKSGKNTVRHARSACSTSL